MPKLVERLGFIGRGALLFDVMSKGSDSFALRDPCQKALMPNSFPENTFPADYAIKDIRLALELVAQGGIGAAAAKLTAGLLEKSSNAGYQSNHYPAMISLIEGNAR